MSIVQKWEKKSQKGTGECGQKWAWSEGNHQETKWKGSLRKDFAMGTLIDMENLLVKSQSMVNLVKLS